MNILILSSGTRNKVIQYMKQHKLPGDKIIAADCSEYAPSLYEADKYYVIPRISDENYLDTILAICSQENIDGIFSLIDPELSILSKHRHLFESIGTKVMVSDYRLVELSYNKFLFQKRLKECGFNYIKSYTDIDSFKLDYQNNKIDFPVFLKPYDGSASKGIRIVEDYSQLIGSFEKKEKTMIQEFMSGKEYGADVYIDFYSGKVNSIFIKQKLVMRAGETDKSISIYEPKIEQLILDFLDQFSFKGIIDIDIFERNGVFYISEVNPRFGGGYLHGEETGYSVIPQLFNNIKGLENKEYKINKGPSTVMMKYADVKVREVLDK